MKRVFYLNRNYVTDNIFWGDVVAPSYCYVEITRRCNCCCEYCQVNATNSGKDMNFELFKKSIDQLHDLKVFEIRLGGGEPLLDPKLIEKVKYITKKKMAVWICTNGTNLTKEKVFELQKNKVTGVRISLDSVNPLIHDKIRGLKGCYEKAIQGLRECKKQQLAVIISMTVGSHNYHEIEKMQRLAKSYEVELTTHVVMPVGKGKEFIAANQTFNYEKIVEMVDQVKGEKHCVALTQSIALDIEGNVSACTFLKPVANIKDKSLLEILNSEDMQKYTRQVPQNSNCPNCDFSKTSKNEKCILAAICRGGCWALYENK